jgi:hypothetical protein
LPGTLPIADTHSTPQSHSTARFSALKLAIIQFLEPGVLPVLALALIVGGWSYGLKLSHYFHHTDVTKASTTRMWLDHRNEAAVAPAADHQVEHNFLTPQLNTVAVPHLPHLSRQQLIPTSSLLA